MLARVAEHLYWLSRYIEAVVAKLFERRRKENFRE